MTDFGIDYVKGLSLCLSADLEGTVAYLMAELPPRWCEAYDEMTEGRNAIGYFTDGSFEVAFDHGSDVDVPPEEKAADRVVAIYGLSQAVSEKRDASRMAGFIRGSNLNRTRLVEGKEVRVSYDKGHLMAHSMGGGTDVNLIPQRRDINRGWSERGKIYRQMERYGAAHPGTFCFSRPIYRDRSWVPFEIEYGVLREPRDLWVERFEN